MIPKISKLSPTSVTHKMTSFTHFIGRTIQLVFIKSPFSRQCKMIHYYLGRNWTFDGHQLTQKWNKISKSLNLVKSSKTTIHISNTSLYIKISSANLYAIHLVHLSKLVKNLMKRMVISAWETWPKMKITSHFISKFSILVFLYACNEVKLSES